MNLKRPIDLPTVILSIFGIGTMIILIAFFYLSVYGKDYSSIYSEKINKGEIDNPITKFSLVSEEVTESEDRVIKVNTPEGIKTIIIKSDVGDLTVNDIERELVNYMGVYLKLYNLHEIPFTSITPKIQVYLEDKPYLLEIVNGVIIIDDIVSENPDIIIRTAYEEVFKMAENEDYAKESISLEKTKVEIVENNFVLFSKGYLSLYNELKGSFSGYIISRI